MWRISLANLRHKPGRFIATSLAVVIGTGFLASTLVLRDSLGPALADSQSIALANVSAVVLPSAGEDSNDTRSQAQQQLRSVPADVLPKVQGAQGAAAAAGLTTGPLKLLGPDNKVVLPDLTGRGWIGVAQINPFSIVDGGPPTGSGQVTFDADTAHQQNLGVGSHVTLATTTGAKQATVVGLTHFGDKISYSPQGDVLVNPADTSAFLNSGQAQYDAIYAVAAAGVDQATLAASVAKAVGPSYDVQTGSYYLASQQQGAQSIATVIGVGLQAFAYVALVVAAFIIYNTFTTVVTQRTRELALLRAVGASGRQVKRSIRVEATAVGLVASCVGMLLGVVAFIALTRLVPQFKALVGNDIAARVNPSSVLQVLISGTAITLVSSIVPGWRAARTPPVAAMRATAIDSSSTSRARFISGTLLLILSISLLAIGAATSTALVVGFGALVSFVAVLAGGPVLAHNFAKLAGAPTRLAGAPGHLAVENVERNATRTATTANALVIGVFMVVFVTAAGGSLRDWSVSQLSKLSGADYTITTTGGSSLPTELLAKVQSTPGVGSAAAAYADFATPLNEGWQVGAVDFAKAAPVFDLKQSSGAPLASLSGDQVAVAGFPRGNGRGQNFPQVGQSLTIHFNNGVTKQVTVASTYAFNLALPVLILLPTSTALNADPQLKPSTIGVQVSGSDPNVSQELQNLVSDYSNVEVQPGNFIAQTLKNVFTGLINSVNALLGVAIAIALFGIVNTLILSIAERTQEIGVLRAVGMSRHQLGTMIRLEAVIVALLGTLVGMAFGLAVAFSLVRPLLDQASTAMNWPIAHLAIILLAGVVVGVVASVIPAHRATRLNPLDAIREL